jgi:hypothetical protein
LPGAQQSKQKARRSTSAHRSENVIVGDQPRATHGAMPQRESNLSPLQSLMRTVRSSDPKILEASKTTCVRPSRFPRAQGELNLLIARPLFYRASTHKRRWDAGKGTARARALFATDRGLGRCLCGHGGSSNRLGFFWLIVIALDQMQPTRLRLEALRPTELVC